MNKKTLIISGVLIIVLAGAATAVLRLRGNEDVWLCQSGEWVKHGNPDVPKPTEACGTPKPSLSPSPSPSQPATSDIEVYSPKPNSIIKSPLILEGQAQGGWYFEASAPVKLLDSQGNKIAEKYIQAVGDWMTSDLVPFRGVLEFNVTSQINGALVFNNDNPSGLPENSKEFRVPVVISPEKGQIVKAFFANERLDPEISCNKMFAVERIIAPTQATGRAALSELLKGPTENEKKQGYYTAINEGTEINSLFITNGTAKVDFNKKIEEAVGGSCHVTAIRTQITQTLMQFSTVKSVVISVEGRTEDILQP